MEQEQEQAVMVGEQVHHCPITKTRKWYKNLKMLIPVIVIILLCGVIGWQFFGIERIKTLISRGEDVEEKVNYSNFTAISLRGNDQVVYGEKDLPIRGWNIEFRYGDISFHHDSEVHIGITGVYYVYLQMFFYQNGDTYSSTMNGKDKAIMDIGITNKQLNKRHLSATVPLISCMNVCTKHISTLLHLKEGYVLSVGTATPGIRLKMVKERTFFVVVLLHRDP